VTPLPTIASIQKATAARYRVSVSSMREPRPSGRARTNTRRVCRARQVAMCLSARLTDHSLVRIGHFFGGRDHSTVIHACREVEKRRAKDQRLHNAMRRITLELVRR
jgi:chromosomal replication initiator protein